MNFKANAMAKLKMPKSLSQASLYGCSFGLAIILIPALLFGQDVFLKITDRGRNRIKIAVLNFALEQKSQFSVDPALTESIPRILKKDLKFSLFFDILDSVEMPQVGPLSEDEFDYPSWATKGVQALVLGFLRGKDEKLEVQVFVESVVLRKRVFKRAYECKKGEERRLTHTIADDITRFLTGEDGVCRTRIFFVSTRSGTKELYVSDYDGMDVERLTHFNSISLFPALSPDNKLLAFSSFKDKGLGLYMLDLEKKKAELLVNYEGMNGPCAFSPDGKKLALVLSKDGNSEIYVMDLRNQHLERLTFEWGIDTSPCWSPTGNEIAFTSDRSGSPQIYIMDATGANVRRLTFQGKYNDQPDWSPRGDRIAYASMLDDVFDIVTIGVDGENALVLTSGGNNQNPSWSPDGYHIVFSSNRDGSYKLYTMSWIGTDISLISQSGEDFSPVWSSRYNWKFEK